MARVTRTAAVLAEAEASFCQRTRRRRRGTKKKESKKEEREQVTLSHAWIQQVRVAISVNLLVRCLRIPLIVKKNAETGERNYEMQRSRWLNGCQTARAN